MASIPLSTRKTRRSRGRRPTSAVLRGKSNFPILPRDQSSKQASTRCKPGDGRRRDSSNAPADEVRERFNQELAKSKEIIEKIPAPNRRPEWYIEMLFLGFSQRWSREDYDKVFCEAVKTEPGYYELYRARAMWLEAVGEPGDWERSRMRLQRSICRLRECPFTLGSRGRSRPIIKMSSSKRESTGTKCAKVFATSRPGGRTRFET